MRFFWEFWGVCLVRETTKVGTKKVWDMPSPQPSPGGRGSKKEKDGVGFIGGDRGRIVCCRGVGRRRGRIVRGRGGVFFLGFCGLVFFGGVLLVVGRPGFPVSRWLVGFGFGVV